MSPHTPSPVEPIREALDAGDHARAATLLTAAALDPADVRGLFGEVSISDAAAVLSNMEEEPARAVVAWLPLEQSGAILTDLEPQSAARLLAGLPSDERTDLLSAIDEEPRGAIQSHLPPLERAESVRLLKYPPDVAGGLMETELLAYPAATTVRDVIRDVRANQSRYAALPVQYLYVVDGERRLIGVAPIRDLLLAPEERALHELIRGETASVRDTATTPELADLFDAHSYEGLPVVDERGVLLGMVNRADVTESEHHESEEQYRLSQGIVGGEELRSMPVFQRVRRRSAWLGVNLILCLGGAAVIALNQGTIAKVLVVAAALPVISATSGNAAMQAAAVSIRELTIGVIEPRSWRRVLVHEAGLGALMAVPMGLGVALLTTLWGGSAMIGLATGLAMALNTLIAVGVGALCPLALRRVNVDPALASGPISTTISDITGFALTLGLVAAAS